MRKVNSLASDDVFQMSRKKKNHSLCRGTVQHSSVCSALMDD